MKVFCFVLLWAWLFVILLPDWLLSRFEFAFLGFLFLGLRVCEFAFDLFGFCVVFCALNDIAFCVWKLCCLGLLSWDLCVTTGVGVVWCNLVWVWYVLIFVFGLCLVGLFIYKIFSCCWLSGWLFDLRFFVCGCIWILFLAWCFVAYLDFWFELELCALKLFLILLVCVLVLIILVVCFGLFNLFMLEICYCLFDRFKFWNLIGFNDVNWVWNVCDFVDVVNYGCCLELGWTFMLCFWLIMLTFGF